MGIFAKTFGIHQPDSDRLRGLETETEYRQRWISIRVMYFTAYLVYVGFGIAATCLWPYLKTLDPEAGKVFLAYLFAMPSVLQLVGSPVLGWWSNKLSSVRYLIIPFLVCFIAGQIIYALAEEFTSHQKYVILTSRVLVGVSMISCSIYRSYISAATTVAERTRTTSYLSLAHVAGLLSASVLQPFFSALGEEGFRIPGLFRVNMHTSVGWFCALLGVVNLVLMLPFIFKDFNIALKEATSDNAAVFMKNRIKSMELRGLPITLMCVAFALLMFVYAAFQTLLSPVALDQFGWTNEESLFYLGILMTAGALISCVLFLLLDPLCKRFGETNVLVYGAMFALFLSQLLMIPVGTQTISESVDSVNGTIGCPVSQEWCQSIPPVSIAQFTVSYTLLCVSFSIGTTLSQAVFSKLLGPRPQGTWMALLTCAGSAARIVGPASVTVYVILGTYWTFGASAVLSGLIFLWMWVYRNSLSPTQPAPVEAAEELKVLNV
ncbi:major facilitator superfamily domain-containing protein 8-like isoform X1 [Wyeomyia smithii]|uniref:major facilitator superfamily domain-containing protein 8-like isoform X1 n=1 Tax=Wyeomyia smithii TaxID=174621 RepID=UPI002467D128|nr:major facilitator superfamily domain-containing protein 8-like isoform X1 [Wyeomyia smithii]